MDDLNDKTVAELKDIAAARGIDLGEATKKADIIAAIVAADGESGDGPEQPGRNDGSPPPNGAPAAGMKTVIITAPHVYLPLDLDGNARTDWAQAEDTTRVEKRTRLQAPADLAEFLSARDQAEVF